MPRSSRFIPRPSVGEADAVVRGHYVTLYFQGASLGHGSQGVACQVPEDLADLVGISDQGHGWRIDHQIQVMLRRNLRAVDQQLHVLAQQSGDVEAHAGAFFGSGELQKALDGAVQPLAFLENDVQKPAMGGIILQGGGEHLNRAGDGGQRIADLVGNARCQLADRGESLPELQLVLQLPPFGQVLEDEDETGPGAFGVGQQRDGVTDVALGVTSLVGDLGS